MAHILIVDDEPKLRHILRVMLTLKGYHVDEAGDGEEALEKLSTTPYDLVISDIKMPRLDGFSLLARIKAMELPCPVVFITAFATVDTAVEALKHGAVDFITKPFEEERILLTIEKAVGIGKIINENKQLKEELARTDTSDDPVIVSSKMIKLLEMARKVALKPDTTVMITGESGVGKEVVARFIHRHSQRSNARFVPVNCAAISESLVESILFGHERGAFTGADKKKMGFFEYASGGTLMLDEVGDLPEAAQAKLLRALQEKIIQRVGGNEEIKVDVRLICATNRDLKKMVDEGRFREDLYYRINVFPLEVPPLRERKEDIVPLAEYFIKKFRLKTTQDPKQTDLLTNGAKRILMEHKWPGNIRELSNAVERAVILAGDAIVSSDDLAFLKPGIVEGIKPGLIALPTDGIDLEELEKDLIRQAIAATNDNVCAAARLLGLTRSKLRTRVKQLEEDENTR